MGLDGSTDGGRPGTNRAKAAADAVSQARALAAALGVKLKRVLHASTSAEPRPILMNMGMARMAAAASWLSLEALGSGGLAPSCSS